LCCVGVSKRTEGAGEGKEIFTELKLLAADLVPLKGVESANDAVCAATMESA
jgi:hypothetical protein